MINKHIAWIIGLIVITLIICATIVFLSYHPLTFVARFEADDGMVQVFKSINWGVFGL